MTFTIIHELPIATTARDIYRALTEQDMLARWWLAGARVEEGVGGLATFPLSDGSSFITLRIEELLADRRVLWRCVAHKHHEWIGTTIRFEISADSDATSILRFIHEGWNDTGGVYGRVSYYWAALYLSRLKSLLET